MTKLTTKKWLITTPDYPPRLGGLSTYTLALEKALEVNQQEFDVVVWNDPREMSKVDASSYERVLNIHYMGGFFGRWNTQKNTNFIHGSEILFYSPNIIKKIIKKILRPKMISYFQNSHENIFISEFTMNKLNSFGLNVDYSRDSVFHNCIDTNGAELIDNNIISEILFVCIVRDVPHKNLDGVVKLLEDIAAHNPTLKIKLLTNSSRITSNRITIEAKSELSDSQREEFYRRAHFNILLSKDDSDKGFYEGFGLTCLEAGKYGVPSIVSNTGGLPENVHHLYNGVVFNPKFTDEFHDDFKKALGNYSKMRDNTFKHTLSSHSIDMFSKLFRNRKNL